MSAVSVLLSEQDSALGARIADALSRCGHTARVIPADQAGDLLLEAGLDDDAAIVVWSNAALRLARLHDQAREALTRGALVPVAVGGARVPAGFEALPPVDLSGWRGDDRDPRWRFVLDEVTLAAKRRRQADQSAWIDAQIAMRATAHQEGDSEIHGQTARDDEVGPQGTNLQQGARRPSRLAAPKRRRTRRRYNVATVGVVGVMALCAATGVAIIFAPSPDRATSDAPAEALVEPPLTEDERGATGAGGQADSSDAAPPVIAASDPSPVGFSSVDGASAPPAVPGDAVNNAFLESLSGVSAPVADAQASDMGNASAAASQPLESVLAAAGPASPGGAPDMDEKAGEMAAPAPELSPQSEPAPSQALEDLIARVAGAENGAAVDGTTRFRDCAACPELARVPAGAFTMGAVASDARPGEGPPQRMVIETPFAIGVREVTFAEYDACIIGGGCAGDAPYDYGWGRGAQPVVGISKEDAQAYVAWLSAKTGEEYRLPTEAEWEYAARAGAETAFSFGAQLAPVNANYNARFPYRGPAGRGPDKPLPAGQYQANAFGLFDMHGNVWEWTADCWRASHAGRPASPAARSGGDCARGVIKGGAFNTGGWRLRVGHRLAKPAGAREHDIGFRVVRTLN